MKIKPTFLFYPLRRCEEWAKAYVEYRLGDIIPSVAECIAEIDDAKLDKPVPTPCTIPTTGWQSDSTAGYPKYYDISVTGITAKDRAEITISHSSLDTAKTCGLCPTNETLAGKIRVRAVSVPTKAISAEYWIMDGKE